MLTSLKGLLNVGKSGLQESSEAQPGVNVNAGAEVLARFQQEWAELHALNENNAENAEKLAVEISRLQTVIDKDHESAGHLVQLLTSTPTLKDGVEGCLMKITDLHESFDKVEKALLSLEDLIEDIELKQRKFENRYQFALYKEKKLANLEAARQKLAAEHAQKIMEYDLKQKQILQERQQVFHEAFHYDLEAYKSSGELPKIEVSKTQAQPSALLEEIQLDLDKKELDQFLDET